MHAVEPPRGSVGAALRALRDAERNLGASSEVEQRLRSEVRAIRERRRRARLVTFAAAAVLMVVIAGSLRLGAPDQLPTTGNRPPAEVVTAFFPLVYGSVPMTNGQVVRMEVPRTALASFGLGAVEALGSPEPETLLADVLVGEDGLARAVRFVRPVRKQEQQR
jgi:hypothetical protein